MNEGLWVANGISSAIMVLASGYLGYSIKSLAGDL